MQIVAFSEWPESFRRINTFGLFIFSSRACRVVRAHSFQTRVVLSSSAYVVICQNIHIFTTKRPTYLPTQTNEGTQIFLGRRPTLYRKCDGNSTIQLRRLVGRSMTLTAHYIAASKIAAYAVILTGSSLSSINEQSNLIFTSHKTLRRSS